MNRKDFWRQHPGLVWSNPNAPDSAFIRNALLRPRFLQILDIAMEFGLDRVKEEWQVLLTDPPSRLPTATVERCLKNIGEGFRRAQEEQSHAAR